MTLREILNEETYLKRNYYAFPEKEKSVVSGKTILGFPGDRSIFYLEPGRGMVYDIANVGDNNYEFYINTRKDRRDKEVYKKKENYVGTMKINRFHENDDVGIALALIKRFFNSKKIDEENREFLRNFYNKHKEFPYYKNYFNDLPLKEEEED